MGGESLRVGEEWQRVPFPRFDSPRPEHIERVSGARAGNFGALQAGGEVPVCKFQLENVSYVIPVKAKKYFVRDGNGTRGRCQ